MSLFDSIIGPLSGMNATTKSSVTRADREAAAAYWQVFVARAGESIVGNQMRKGRLDEAESVQAFARHRTQAEGATRRSALVAIILGGLSGALVGAVIGAGGVWAFMVTPC
jgi:hypothetical protein